MVAIQITNVGPVMYAVVRGRVKNKLDGLWKFIERFCVKPVLVDKANAQHGDDHCGVEAKKCQRNPEGVFEYAFPDTLPKRRTKIVVLRVVVRDVSSP